MSTDPYFTLETDASTGFVVQGSEFIGHASPVGSVEAAEAFLERVREAYDDATHNVPAYRVRAGTDGELLREYSSDDGEPSGSAGKPALNVLVQQDLENCAVVVTRYYGGTNLGVGGLVRAYSRATTDVIEEAGIIEQRPQEQVRITVEYDDSGTVRSILESEGFEFDASYGKRVRFDVRAPVDGAEAFRDRIRSATSGRAKME